MGLKAPRNRLATAARLTGAAPRKRAAVARRPALRASADPLFLGADLALWAGVSLARAGRKDALLGRVEALHLTLDGARLEARVRGARPVPFLVRVAARDGRLVTLCSCAEALEPVGLSSAPAAGPPGDRTCRHAVAALEALRFPLTRPGKTARAGRRGGGRARAGRSRILQHAAPPPGWIVLGADEPLRNREQRVTAARDEEIAACRRRARRLRVRPGPPGGAAQFEVFWPGREVVQRVTSRAFSQRLSCTCDDFAVNELETCEHIERVRRSRLLRRLQGLQTSPPVLSVSWQPRPWIDRVPLPLCEVRFDGPQPADRARRSVERFFDEAGWLVPDARGGLTAARVSQACAAARRAAREGGWTFDLDPAVPAALLRARAEEQSEILRGAAADDAELWQAIVSRLHVRLHRYQEDGARFLARAGRAFLADDMGLGKTIQAIVAALLLRRAVGARRALVVCPASIKHQWLREIEAATGERPVVASGPRAERLAAYAAWREGFLIVNYELLLRDFQPILATAADLVILDEAQRIKNWTTKTASAVKRLNSKHAFVLTGTPLENRLGELHSIVEFLYPRAAGPRWRLVPFHTVSDARGRAVAYEALDTLRQRLAGFFLRRERREVQNELPARTDNTFWTELSRAQRVPYRRHASRLAALLAHPGPLGAPDVRALLTALTSMRVLCNALGQHEWRRWASRVAGPPPSRSELRELQSPKLEEFAQVIEDLLEESEEKIVVFSQWERMLCLARWVVSGLLEQRGLRADLFFGGLPGASREPMLDSFARDPDFRILFSTDAGGVGLNLQAASIVVQLEVPWNPAVLEQRIGRVHRLGQRHSVQVLHFVTRGAIEERVRQVVEAKRALFSGLLVEGADEVVLDPRAQGSFLERLRQLVDHQSSNSRTS